MDKTVHHKAHADDEGVDRIEIVATPRYKTSGLSGNEWRVGAVIRFYRKGELVHKAFRNKMTDAAAHLAYIRDSLPWTDGVRALWALDAEECHQFGCSEPAETVYRLKQEFSDRGDGPLPDLGVQEVRRAFCTRHARRGDCGREDSDRNYEHVSGPDPRPRTDDESPAATVYVDTRAQKAN